MDSFYFKIKQIFGKVKKLLSPFYFWKKKSLMKAIGAKQVELDKKLVYAASKLRLPSLKQIKYLNKFLSQREKIVLGVSMAILFISIFFLGARFYRNHLKVVPKAGGEYIEGLIGTPKYINPLYANFSDVDHDISRLVFSSLLTRDVNGVLVNDLASQYEVSEDFKTYTFKIRKDVKWHNGSPLTVDDILFTFNAIKDGHYNSPLRETFNGVEIEKVDEETVRFLLSESYAAFLDLLTFGVIPQDLWYQISPSGAGLAELNLKPIGSGSYKFKSLSKDSKGQIKSYSLTVNEEYYNQKAYIEDIVFKFYPNFEEAVRALNDGLVNGVGYLPKRFEKDLVAKDSFNLYKLNLPQLTAVFFNQKDNEALKDKSVRQSLAIAINKQKIIEDVLQGDARLIDGPILPDSFAYNSENKKYNYNKDEAVRLLDEAGWKKFSITEDDLLKAKEEKEGGDEAVKKEAELKLSMGAGEWRRKDDKFLVVKLTTVDLDENKEVAELIKHFWEEVGVKTNVEVIATNQIETDVIKPRNFEVLFYGQIVGADPDLYVFWHSSQVGRTGLNLSNYANKEVDKLLEDARITSDLEARKEKYKKFQGIITEDLATIFMYSPTYTYVQTKKVKGFGVKSILAPMDRFADIFGWHIKTKKKLFLK